MAKKNKTSMLTFILVFIVFSLLLSCVFLVNKDKGNNVVDDTPRIELTDSNGKELKDYVFNN